MGSGNAKPHHGVVNAAPHEPNKSTPAIVPARRFVLGEEVKLLSGDADPVSLAILQYVKQADDLEPNYDAVLVSLEKAASLLREAPLDAVDGLSVLIFQREGLAFYNSHRQEAAKMSFGKAIQIAEIMVSERRPRLYMVLQRYSDAVLMLVALWMKEAESVLSAAPNDEEQRNLRLSLWSPCELALLRCIEIIEMGDHKQSELLLLPLIELARVYEELRVYTQAVLVIRRCIGLLCVRYGHDHIRLTDLNLRCDRLLQLRDEQIRFEAILTLQSLFRMMIAMRRLEVTLGRRVRRHHLLSKREREATLQRQIALLHAATTTPRVTSPNATLGSTTGSSSISGGDGGYTTNSGGGGGAKLSIQLYGREPTPVQTALQGQLSPTEIAAGGVRKSPFRPSSATSAGSRPSSAAGGCETPLGSSLTAQQRTLLTSGYNVNFIRSSFATQQSTSRPTSATAQGRLSTIRPSNEPTLDGLGATATMMSQLASAGLVGSSGGSISAAAGGGGSATTTTVANPESRRSRLRSWAAYEPAV